MSGTAVEMKRSPKGSFLIFDSSSSPSPSVMICSLNPLLSETMDSVHLSIPLAQLQMKNTKIRSAGKFPPETFDPERKYRSENAGTEEPSTSNGVQFELQKLVDVYEMREQCNEKRFIPSKMNRVASSSYLSSFKEGQSPIPVTQNDDGELNFQPVNVEEITHTCQSFNIISLQRKFWIEASYRSFSLRGDINTASQSAPMIDIQVPIF